jgi:predicted Zn-dependent protease with MMP-like domain
MSAVELERLPKKPNAPMIAAISSSGTPIAGERKIVSDIATSSPMTSIGTNQIVSLEGIHLGHTLGYMARNRAGSAIAISAFVTGIIVWFVNPPSLSGAGGLASLVIGAAAFVYFTAWLTTLLMGDDLERLPEEEFERIVVRSEELAREPQLAREATEFEVIVAAALDRLPAEFQEVLREVPVVVSQRGEEFHAYGHYYGDTVAGGRYEHRIVIYQDTLVRDFGWNPELLGEQVERVVRHEVAHHLGWDESGVRSLGL